MGRFHRSIVGLLGTLLLILIACQSPSPNSTSSNQPQQPNYTPFTLENCGVTITYDKPPQRAVTMLQPQTEILLALGLEGRMAGTAYRDAPILPEYQKAYETVPVLATTYPSREVLLSVEPDFVYAGLESAFGKEAAGPRQELLDLGIRSYLSRIEADGSCKPESATVNDLYSEIRDIGRIFGVQEKAETLIASMQAQLTEIQAKLGKIEQPKRVFWYDTDDPPYTAGCCSMPNLVMELAGGENIFRDAGRGGIRVNWEDVVNLDPDVIILSQADWSPVEAKRKLLEQNPAYRKMKAVRNQQFIVLDFNYMLAGVRNPAGIRKLAEALYPERFQ